MSDIHNTTHSRDEDDADIPVLTDVIKDGGIRTLPENVWTASSGGAPAPAMTTTIVTTAEPTEDTRTELQTAARLPSIEEIEATLSSRLTAELALQIPVLLEAALREHLPKAIGAKLQAELVSALANALPGAAQNAAAELSSTLAFEVGGLLEQRIEDEVRRAVSDEITRLSEDQQTSR
jgi:hypothetical protein